MLGHHALCEVKSLVQRTGVTEVQRVNQEPKESTLKPERRHLQDDPQEDRDDVEHGDGGTFQNVLLVYVFICGVKMEHGSRNQHGHELEGPKHLGESAKTPGLVVTRDVLALRFWHTVNTVHVILQTLKFYLRCNRPKLIVAEKVELSFVRIAAEVKSFVPVNRKPQDPQEEHAHRPEKQGVELTNHGWRPKLKQKVQANRFCVGEYGLNIEFGCMYKMNEIWTSIHWLIHFARLYLLPTKQTLTQ